MSIPKWRSLVETAKHQIYISRKHDPFLNLSIEHYLLQKTPSDSTVLFLYVNKPCVVIGRNQNPWLEVNLGFLTQSSEYNAKPPRNVQLVRRRSGGGAVFHDEGNVNYSVICPSASFTRDKHAEMVARAIRRFSGRARVNERHDIVFDPRDPLDNLQQLQSSSLKDMKAPDDRALKVSGSAYKLTRQRSLHHARPFLKARGVESVRSPVGNVFPQNQNNLKDIRHAFEDSVVDEFRIQYDIDLESTELFKRMSTGKSAFKDSVLRSGNTWAAGLLGEDLERITEISKGVEELKSLQWIYAQTPQFTLSTHAHEADERERPSLPDSFPSHASVYLKARGGAFTETRLSVSPNKDLALSEIDRFDSTLKGKNVHDIGDFVPYLKECDLTEHLKVNSLGLWLNAMFGKSLTVEDSG
ncbi:MAG: hypothetical protein Q9164_006239 [Protoblastenia rupestris]